MRELWRPKDHAPETYLGSPMWALLARISSRPWLALEVYNGRTVESIHTSAPQDVESWVRVAGPRQFRKVTLLIPDQHVASRWVQVAVIAIWQAGRSEAAATLYFEDTDGAAWQPSGLSCALPPQVELISLWEHVETRGRQRVHTAP